MPILADALMDAGCDNDVVLRHCRNGRRHTRGCWVIDLLLGIDPPVYGVSCENGCAVIP